MNRTNIPLIVILGPTASGKSDLGIQLARKFNGEIVSADSRQVYKGLDIGTGKVTKAEQKLAKHYLLDVAKPCTRFNVAEYKKIADKAIFDIWKRGKVPFLVGGSPLYIQAVVDNYQLGEGVSDQSVREKLEVTSLSKLLAQLKKVDPESYKIIDKKNKRRVVRALEVYHATGKKFSQLQRKGEDQYRSLLLGIDIPRETLYKRIDDRVDARVQQGMIKEVERLLKKGVSSEWLSTLGLEYRFISNYLLNTDKSKEARGDMLQKLKFAIHDFTRRQLTWFRREKRIHWIEKNMKAKKLVERFLRL
ncbi:MAG: tRNA (adenosine(37)-N6)-dimethylallyltransferase MiaA [Nanoarchaeota archaeon]|nr:tRNA (adenosine(37)-N6)-dimethylallyltransferase MiaA [Nanoarchaeota archaeon]